MRYAPAVTLIPARQLPPTRRFAGWSVDSTCKPVTPRCCSACCDRSCGSCSPNGDTPPDDAWGRLGLDSPPMRGGEMMRSWRVLLSLFLFSAVVVTAQGQQHGAAAQHDHGSGDHHEEAWGTVS